MEKFIGCSGFHYAHWKGKFYPEKLPKNRWLHFYSRTFNTVEINNTFYRMPEVKNLKIWMNQTPPDFKFTLKANRYFTHQKKLVVDDDFRNHLNDFTEIIKVLDNKLGCMLWQLPGSLHKDISKLEKLCTLLNHPLDHIFEFRHPSWFTEDIFTLLSEHNIGYCMVSAPGGIPEIARATASTAYLRFHGKTAWYKHDYTEDELQTWHHKIQNLQNITRLFIYFNNDYEARAVKNAALLSEMLR